MQNLLPYHQRNQAKILFRNIIEEEDEQAIVHLSEQLYELLQTMDRKNVPAFLLYQKDIYEKIEKVDLPAKCALIKAISTLKTNYSFKYNEISTIHVLNQFIRIFIPTEDMPVPIETQSDIVTLLIRSIQADQVLEENVLSNEFINCLSSFMEYAPDAKVGKLIFKILRISNFHMEESILMSIYNISCKILESENTRDKLYAVKTINLLIINGFTSYDVTSVTNFLDSVISENSSNLSPNDYKVISYVSAALECYQNIPRFNNLDLIMSLVTSQIPQIASNAIFALILHKSEWEDNEKICKDLNGLLNEPLMNMGPYVQNLALEALSITVKDIDDYSAETISFLIESIPLAEQIPKVLSHLVVISENLERNYSIDLADFTDELGQYYDDLKRLQFESDDEEVRSNAVALCNFIDSAQTDE